MLAILWVLLLHRVLGSLLLLLLLLPLFRWQDGEHAGPCFPTGARGAHVARACARLLAGYGVWLASAVMQWCRKGKSTHPGCCVLSVLVRCDGCGWVGFGKGAGWSGVLARPVVECAGVLCVCLQHWLLCVQQCCSCDGLVVRLFARFTSVVTSGMSVRLCVSHFVVHRPAFGGCCCLLLWVGPQACLAELCSWWW